MFKHLYRFSNSYIESRLINSPSSQEKAGAYYLELLLLLKKGFAEALNGLNKGKENRKMQFA
jgi:hypothetical protein